MALRFEGSRIPDPGFAGDDGSPDPALRAALAGYRDGSGDYPAVLAELRASRLLVPVVAVPGEPEVDAAGSAHEKTSDMATVLIARPDGRRAMLAFTGTDALRAWNPEARPVPVPAPLAARAALQEGATTLLVDAAGPVRFTVAGGDLHAVAAGWQLTRVGDRTAWIRPAAE